MSSYLPPPTNVNPSVLLEVKAAIYICPKGISILMHWQVLPSVVWGIVIRVSPQQSATKLPSWCTPVIYLGWTGKNVQGKNCAKWQGMDKVFLPIVVLRRMKRLKDGAAICLKPRTTSALSSQNSFHGRTLLTVSATANPTARAGFTLDDDFICVPFGDMDAIRQQIAQHDNVCAIMLEPIQGESGVNTAFNGFDF